MLVSYRQLLLSELRMAVSDGKDIPLTEHALQKAMTVNENLRSLGFVLRPDDLVRLAQNDAIDRFYAELRPLVGDVTAEPMYPDFPAQVMKISEAQFRFHQAVHYFSTYDMEKLFGGTVSKGWMPDVERTEKTESDDRLLAAQVLELVSAKDVYAVPLRRLLSRCERLTEKGLQLVTEAVKHVNAETLADLTIPFKQNAMVIFWQIFSDDSLSNRLDLLHAICQHTGDVLKCTDYVLTRSHYHFRTSQKRLLVKLLEAYPENDFRSNLILSGKKANRSLLMLQYLDYNQYSRSAAHRAAVADLRDGKLRSWESQVKYLLAQQHPDALTFIAERPGMLLRMTAWLVRLGIAPAEIQAQLLTHADALRTQTLVTILTKYGADKQVAVNGTLEEQRVVYDLLLPVLQTKLRTMQTPLQGKRVCVQMPEYDLLHSHILCSEQSDEGGYVRSGLAYRIPEQVKVLRFFIYWNDSKRVDVDLHCFGETKTGDMLHIGWNSNFRKAGLVHSGDITHSDAAEYIDIDLDKEVCYAYPSIHLYGGKPSFGDIDTCFTGMMAVNRIRAKVKLYDPANCFFTHHLISKQSRMQYGYIDCKRRYLVFLGQPTIESFWKTPTIHLQSRLHLQAYLQLMFEAQGVQCVDTPEQADLTLVMGKPQSDAEISLLDHNFFFDA